MPDQTEQFLWEMSTHSFLYHYTIIGIRRKADQIYRIQTVKEIYFYQCNIGQRLFEPVHEISNNVVCATSKASDQPAHMRSLIRAFASRLSIL